MKRSVLTVVFLTIALAAGCGEQKMDMPAESMETAFADMSFEEQHSHLSSELETAKAALMAKGEYRCCVLPSCNWCLINDKHCKCATHLEEGGGVCGGCGQSWAMGRGVLPGVDPEDVKWGPGAVHEH